MLRPSYWIGAQLPPALAAWINASGGRAAHMGDLGMLSAPDPEIFTAARAANAVVVTKDEDSVRLLESLGPPPQVVWITVGNVRNAALHKLWTRSWPTVEALVTAGESLVEVGDPP